MREVLETEVAAEKTVLFGRSLDEKQVSSSPMVDVQTRSVRDHTNLNGRQLNVRLQFVGKDIEDFVQTVLCSVHKHGLD